jgi:hypothetical protein
MSQDQITSSEELSDFSTEKSNNIESVPTSPESSNEKATQTASNDLSNDSPNLNKDNNSIDISSKLPSDNSDSLNEKKEIKAEKKEKKEKEKKDKKEKKAPRAINFASGVSTTVPLTGERPKPEAHSSMEDDVLLAIFIILFDHDPDGKGMTVKQICDILVEKHPDMSKLSSKTSNLVSAKLNAYVKKVEKGDVSIHYALSRDWADSSPKRMVYVYRGILSPDYPAYVQKVIEEHRQKDAAAMNVLDTLNSNNIPIDRGDFEVDMNDSNLVYTSKLKANAYKNDDRSDSNNSSQSPLAHDLSNLHSISPAGLQLNRASPFGNGAIDFDIPQLSVPYAVAPVTASLNISMPIKFDDESSNEISKNYSSNSDFSERKNANQYLSAIPDSDSDDDVYNSLRGGFDDDEDEETSVYENHGYYKRCSEIITERIPSGIGKRSKSISFVNKRSKSNSMTSKTQSDPQERNSSTDSDVKSKRIITAAALTPRVPRKSFANTPNAAAAVAALRAVALGSYNGSMSESVNSITSSIMTDTSVEPSISAKWLETVRSGFLNQDIESPENVSLAELDILFT